MPSPLIPFKWSFAATVAAALFVRYYLQLQLCTIQTCSLVLAPLITYVLLGGWEKVYILIVTLPRDIQGAIFRVRLLSAFRDFTENVRTVPRSLEIYVKKHPNKACFMFEKKTYTFAQVDQMSTEVAIVLRDKLKLKQGDVIGLFMMNRPEYVAIWIGAAKIGCVTALLNTNVRLDSLIHSMQAANCRALIFDSELSPAVVEVQDRLKGAGVESSMLWSTSADKCPVPNHSVLQDELELVRKNNADEIRNFKNPDGKATDPILYIYTSGTTGMPKAALIRNRRVCQAGMGAYLVGRMNSNSVVYCPLPLYHTAGGLIGIGSALMGGTTVVIRSKFSASQYWDDCIYYGCTVGQYIGEMCRYLLAQPAKPTDTKHPVRCIIGNGLRPQIWKQFVERFNTPIYELYGSTEGNANLINYDGTIGACGILSVVIPMEMGIIKCDHVSGEPVRGKNGLCIRCEPGEPGQLVGIIDKTSVLADFAGYTDKKSSEKKVFTNVFSNGDSAFASGDILMMDKFGYTYFVDRIGDTFRWKGENVSTTEVETVLMKIVGMQEDVVVFGVEVPGCEGKAGMAAVTSQQHQSIASPNFASEVEKRLPFYARPLFIRVVPAVESTGTLKLKKVDLRSLGFAPASTDVALYFFNSKTKLYEALTSEIHNNIVSGTLRL